MNSLISEIEQNLPQPSDFGVGSKEYIGLEKEIERLEQVPEKYNYTGNLIGGVFLIVGIFLLGVTEDALFLFLILSGLVGLIAGKVYTAEYEEVRNEIVELKSKKNNVDSKYSSAKNKYIDKELSQYKDTYLYRKRSSGYGFAEHLQIYSDAIEHFSAEYNLFLNDHRDYVNSRNVTVAPYKRPPQQSVDRSQTTENKASVGLLGYFVQEVETVPVTTEELVLEDTTDLPPQQVGQQFNSSDNQSAPRAASQEKANILIGDTGEEAVANYERSMFRESGKKYLADRIEVVSKTIGDGLGYDVLSFDQYGNEKFIEVKTTRSNNPVANFSFTRGELNFLTKNPDTAFVYCVFSITGGNPRLKIYPAKEFLDKSFETVEYRASLR